LADLLKKKNNKFNRLWGTKILVKYDSREKANSMLSGSPEKETQGQTRRNQSPLNFPKRQTSLQNKTAKTGQTGDF
jgi:hypothetical protein